MNPIYRELGFWLFVTLLSCVSILAVGALFFL